MSNTTDNYMLNTHTHGSYKINIPQSSNWKCHMFGKNASGWVDTEACEWLGVDE